MIASFITYFRFAAVVLPIFALSFTAGAMVDPGTNFSSDVLLNPDCKIKRMSNGVVFVTAPSSNGSELTHKFSDFYADLLMAAYRKQSMNYILTTFSKKYYLSQDDCRREIKHAVNTLVEWNIFVRKDQIALQ